jgi:hypothetical protein
VPSKKIVLIHCPKTGGTSIEKWLLKYVGGRYIGEKHDDIFTIRKSKMSISEYFTVARNPYARVVSWYNFRIQRHLEDVEAGVPMTAKDKNLTHEVALKHYGNNFEQWLKKINFNLPRGYNLDYALTRKHVDLLDMDKDPKFILKTESLNEDFQKVQKFFNKEDPLLHLNRTKKVDWKTYYKSDFSKEFVYKHWKEDFEYFGYKKLV